MVRAVKITACGDVKGVGNRRFVWRIAKALDLKGYVENLIGVPCVEIYAEGDDACIEKFKEKISLNKIYEINSLTIVEDRPKNIYSDFMIVKCLDEVL